MGFPYIPDNGAYIVQCDMAETIIVIYMSGLQRFQMRVIISGAIPFYDFMPDSINKGIEVLDLHGCNAISIDFNVSKKLAARKHLALQAVPVQQVYKSSIPKGGWS